VRGGGFIAGSVFASVYTVYSALRNSS
jgi:hypothetical protein